MKLTKTELNKLLKVFSPKKIIAMYTHNKIDLYSKDIDKLIEKKNKKEVNYEKN